MIGALIAALLQPIWTQKISPKSRLSATVQFNSFELPNFLRDAIRAYGELRWSSQRSLRPHADTIEKLEKIRSASGYLSISLRNNSKKEIHGIRLSIYDNVDMIVDARHEGTQKSTEFTKTYEISSLLPNTYYEIDIWTALNLSNYSHINIVDIISITAKEIDQTAIRYQFSKFERSNYLLLRKKVIWISYWIALIIAVILQVIFA